MSYLDSSGLTRLWQHIVAKLDNYVLLSTLNDYVKKEELHTVLFDYRFTQLDYIESDGDCYIDTGVTATQNTGFDVTFYSLDALSSSTYGCILGARESSKVCDYQITTYTSTGDGLSGTVRFGDLDYDAKITVNAKVRHTLLDKSYTAGGTTTAFSQDVEFVTPCSITVFALNQKGTPTQHGKCRIYSLKLYDGSSLIRDFIPVKEIGTGALGLYDQVSHVFYPNLGSGTLSGGITAV